MSSLSRIVTLGGETGAESRAQSAAVRLACLRSQSDDQIRQAEGDMRLWDGERRVLKVSTLGWRRRDILQDQVVTIISRCLSRIVNQRDGNIASKISP